jgi:hypothetical protein
VLPTTNSALAFATRSKVAGGSVRVSESILGRGIFASLHNSSVCVVIANVEGGLSNKSVARVATIQTHHLHYVIEHNTYSF